MLQVAQPSGLTLPGLEGALCAPSKPRPPCPQAQAPPLRPLPSGPAPPLRPRPGPALRPPVMRRGGGGGGPDGGGGMEGESTVGLLSGFVLGALTFQHLNTDSDTVSRPGGRAGGRAAVVPAVPARGSRWPCGGRGPGRPPRLSSGPFLSGQVWAGRKVPGGLPLGTGRFGPLPALTARSFAGDPRRSLPAARVRGHHREARPRRGRRGWQPLRGVGWPTPGSGAYGGCSDLA